MGKRIEQDVLDTYNLGVARAAELLLQKYNIETTVARKIATIWARSLNMGMAGQWDYDYQTGVNNAINIIEHGRLSEG